MAFVFQSALFSLVFVVWPFVSHFKYPHEEAMYFINILFLVFEIIIGFTLVLKFANTQSAAFFRRTAPQIDKKFKKKYQAINSHGSTTKRDI